MDAGSILGLQQMRPTLLDHISAARSPKAQAGHGARLVIHADDGDLDEDLDEDEEDFDGDDDADEDDEDDDEEEEETWQVYGRYVALKISLGLTSGAELPRLAPICQLSKRWTDSAGPASRWLVTFRRRS